jgi:hypothetical protein
VITTTVEYVYIEANPFISIGSIDAVSDEYADLPKPFLDALHGLVDRPDNTMCWRCDNSVGFALREQPSGVERLGWNPTGLARVGDGPVAALCEECTPYVPSAEEAQAAR